MAIENLEFGDSFAGLLVDGVAETPYVGATLKMQSPNGVRIEVPYVTYDDAGQFTHVGEWFREQSPPPNMLLLTADGPVSLFDISWAGHSERYGTYPSLGKLAPAEAVFASRDGALADPLAIKTVRSRIDGLNEWVRDSAVTTTSDTDSEGRVMKVTFELESATAAHWTQGDAAMTIKSGWTVRYPEDAYHRQKIINDNFVIESEFPAGARLFYDHFVEQRKVATLLVFMFSQPISFRQHLVQDERFPARTMGGSAYDYPFVELISTRSVRERTIPVLNKKDLGTPLAFLSQIVPDGLATWASNYEEWRRFILPSAGVLGRKGVFIEDVVLSTSLSLEAAGQLIGERDGERPTWGRKPSTATYVYRCLDLLNVKWGEYVSSNIGLARAIANNYNDVKHYDRGDFPAHEETFLVSTVNRLIVRLLALYLTGNADEILEPYRRGSELWPVQQRFEGSRLRVTDGGTWERTE